jgi:hypothetical protein
LSSLHATIPNISHNVCYIQLIRPVETSSGY